MKVSKTLHPTFFFKKKVVCRATEVAAWCFRRNKTPISAERRESTPISGSQIHLSQYGSSELMWLRFGEPHRSNLPPPPTTHHPRQITPDEPFQFSGRPSIPTRFFSSPGSPGARMMESVRIVTIAERYSLFIFLRLGEGHFLPNARRVSEFGAGDKTGTVLHTMRRRT